MEYIYSVIINKIIKYFNGIAFPVKTDKQIFVFVLPLALVKPAIVLDGIKSPTNIRFGYAVFEGGGIKLNGNIHVLNILLTAIRVNS